jgi:hypothetical protein
MKTKQHFSVSLLSLIDGMMFFFLEEEGEEGGGGGGDFSIEE